MQPLFSRSKMPQLNLQNAALSNALLCCAYESSFTSQSVRTVSPVDAERKRISLTQSLSFLAGGMPISPNVLGPSFRGGAGLKVLPAELAPEFGLPDWDDIADDIVGGADDDPGGRAVAAVVL
jgi:hypothetical protein